jgi:hypothetical protein
MTQGVLMLALTYAALLILLTSLWLHSRSALWLKSGMSVLVLAFCVLSYRGTWQLTGWPSNEMLPERFLLLGSWIREPDKDDNSAGGIDLWAVRLGDDGPGVHPRAYQVPYGAELHQALQEAQRRMGQGRLQMGRRIIEGGERNPQAPMRLAPDRLKIEFYDLPDPALPEK